MIILFFCANVPNKINIKKGVAENVFLNYHSPQEL